MNIIYELWNWIYNIKNNNWKIIKSLINTNVDRFIIKKFKSEEKTIFLLDEQRFSFFSFDIFLDQKDPLDIKQFKKIIEEKKNYIKEKYEKYWEFLYYLIDDIYVNWQKKTYFLWDIWKIHFRLKFVLIWFETNDLFRIFTWNKFFENKNIEIYPQTTFTINFLRDSLKKDEINLLYIFNDYTKLIQIKNWFYHKISKIPYWIEKIKTIFKDNDIYSLYKDSSLNVWFNDFSQKLVWESFNFYSKIICKWLLKELWNSKDIIIISKISNNKFFIDSFSRIYLELIKWYVLPFHSSKNLNKNNYKIDIWYLDLIVFLDKFSKNHK